jgi:hypothetical protein
VPRGSGLHAAVDVGGSIRPRARDRHDSNPGLSRMLLSIHVPETHGSCRQRSTSNVVVITETRPQPLLAAVGTAMSAFVASTLQGQARSSIYRLGGLIYKYSQVEWGDGIFGTKARRLLDPACRLIGAERKRFRDRVVRTGPHPYHDRCTGPRGSRRGACDDALGYVREREQFGRAGRSFVCLALRRVQLRNRIPAVAYSASRGTGVNAWSPVAACIASSTLTTRAGPASSSI